MAERVVDTVPGFAGAGFTDLPGIVVPGPARAKVVVTVTKSTIVFMAKSCLGGALRRITPGKRKVTDKSFCCLSVDTAVYVFLMPTIVAISTQRGL